MHDRPTSNNRAAALLALWAAVVAAFVAMVWRQRWIGDDGFINLRVAANVLDGYGPVFNLGERVEAYTSALWLLGVVAVSGLSGARLEWAAVGLGVGCSLLSVVVASWGSVRLWSSRPLAWATWAKLSPVPLGLLVYVALPPAWDYGTSALETPMSALWLAVVFAQLAALASRADGGADLPLGGVIAAAFTAGLGPLVRPDLALFSAGFLGALGVAELRAGGWRWSRVMVLAVAAGAVPVAAQVFRMGYFAAMVPNTAYAKEAFSSYWSQGWRYFENFFLKYYLPVPLVAGLSLVSVPAFALAARRRRVATLALVTATTACGIAAIVYIVRVGGDFMHGRMFLHGVFGLLLPWMMVPLAGHALEGPSRRAARGVAVVVVVAWAAYVAPRVRMSPVNEWSIGDERGWYTREAGVYNALLVEDYAAFMFHREGVHLREELHRACGADVGARALATGCRPVLYLDQDFGRVRPHRAHRPVVDGAVPDGVGLVAARVPIGIIGLLVGPSMHLVDRAGLSDALHARLELLRRSRPGHEKIANDVWIVARFAAAAPGEDGRVAAARRALGCGDLARLVEATRAPMSLDRFMANVRLARPLHTLRIPLDPFEAERRFCGDGAAAAREGAPRGLRTASAAGNEPAAAAPGGT